MSVTQLIDIILINPTVHLAPSHRDTGLTASYTFEPLSNLVYTRDQQAGLLSPAFCSWAWSFGLFGMCWGLKAFAVWAAGFDRLTVGCQPAGRISPFTPPPQTPAWSCRPPCPSFPTPPLHPQITTCRGIVMGRLRSQQRQRDVELMRFCFDKLGGRRLAGRCWPLGHAATDLLPGAATKRAKDCAYGR
jgi:hypothetical protein